ncbi:hypothetical protein OHA21_29915 [Actinoplanes sp. NBC_00393]|uniref:hypothetical protein n=1 Tax=Actinoplanes sp. NBC_00393 TaxID=2975953 RepID=UPI002E23944B
MNEKQTQRAVEERRPPVPDVWFSSPPEDEPLDDKPRAAAGPQILFSSPARQRVNE